MIRRACITLPPLDGAQALAVVEILDRTMAAIWRTHGDAMADHLALLGLDTPQPPDATASHDDASEDIPF